MKWKVKWCDWKRVWQKNKQNEKENVELYS